MSDITTTAGNEIEALTKERDSLLLRLGTADETIAKQADEISAQDGRLDEHWAAVESLKKLIAGLESENKALLGRLDSETKRAESAENRWKLAMRRLQERFGDGLAVHKADIEALLERLGA